MHALADILDTTGLFYYITMKQYERKIRDEENKRIRRVNISEKLKLIRSKNYNYAERFDFKNLKRFIPPSLRIESYAELFQLLSQLPIEQCMNPNVPLDTFFPCFFINGNYAWISANRNGHYRYFTKRKGGEVIGFDLLDLVEVSYKLSTLDAIKKITELLSLQIVDDRWRKEQKEKYFRNYQFLSNCLQNKQMSDSAVTLYIHECFPVLDALNGLGTFHIHKKQYAYKGQNVFFASSSHLALHISGFSSSKVAKMINLLAVLGFIEKVPVSEIHPALLAEAAKIRERRNLGNMIGFYIVHSFEHVLSEAEMRAKLLSANGVKYSNLSKLFVTEIFGSDFAESVYVQMIQKNKKQPEKKSSTLYNHLDHHFAKILDQFGYVTKSMVLSQPIEGYTDKQCKSHLNQFWTFLIRKYGCSYQKPTCEMKQKYGLTSSEYVAIKIRDN